MNRHPQYIWVLALCSLLLVLNACRPRGILHSGKMRDVLVDMHKTDALIQMSGLQHGHDEAQNIYYAQVMEKHGITQQQFDSSIVWYTSHPLLFDKIYPKVQDRLRQEHKAFEAAHEDELHLHPKKIEQLATQRTFTRAQLDSVLWVAQHGYPNSWNELVHDFENEFFPQIGVLR